VQFCVQWARNDAGNARDVGAAVDSMADDMNKANTPKARALRPKMIRELYGIPQGTLHFYCTGLPEADRLPSVKLPGRRGTKGCRLIMADDLEAWIGKYRAKA